MIHETNCSRLRSVFAHDEESTRIYYVNYDIRCNIRCLVHKRRVHHHVDGIVLLHCIYHGDVTEHTKLLSTNQLVYMRTRFKTRCILLLHVQNFLKCSWVVKLVQRMTHTCTNQLIKRLYVLLYVPACWRPSGTYLSCTGIDRRICLWGE